MDPDPAHLYQLYHQVGKGWGYFQEMVLAQSPRPAGGRDAAVPAYVQLLVLVASPGEFKLSLALLVV